MAERVGFEPTVPLLVHLISSQGRYNRFDTAPYSVFRFPGIITGAGGKIKAEFPALRERGLCGQTLCPSWGLPGQRERRNRAAGGGSRVTGVTKTGLGYKVGYAEIPCYITISRIL